MWETIKNIFAELFYSPKAIIWPLIFIFIGYRLNINKDRRNRRIEAINEFRQVFIEERDKIKAFNIHNHIIQEKAIYEIDRFIFPWQRL